MEVQVIKSQQQYEVALAELEQLVRQDPKSETPKGKRLELMALLVEAYETKEFEVGLPDPIEAIQYRMGQKGQSPRDLIPYIGSRSKVSEVLARKRPLTISMIRALNKGLDIPAKVLLQEPKRQSVAEPRVEWSKFPLREMVRRGYLDERNANSKKDGEKALREFLAVYDASTPVAVWTRMSRHVRTARPTDNYGLMAWTARVIRRAAVSAPSNKFTPATVTLELMRELARISDTENGPSLACDFLSSHGISVVVEPHLPRTYLDGAAILVDAERPIIGLTVRYDRLDNFWLTLAHELAHISLHGGGQTLEFYDDLDVDSQGNTQEADADKMAAEALIPVAEWKKSPADRLRSPEAVKSLASRLGIHPAIIAGRIRHDYRSYRVLKELVGHGQVRRCFPDVRWRE